MLKALFLDLDETLCDTTGANNKALAVMAKTCAELLGTGIDADDFSQRYLAGIYRQLDSRYESLLLPVHNEEQFRLALIQLILNDMGVSDVPAGAAATLQRSFDDARTLYFDFFAGIESWLQQLRQHFTLVVITNGPEFSQVVKVQRVNLPAFVDHVIIGGQEPAQKPCKSIFTKALRLADCQADEVLHIGDSLSADIQGAMNANIDSVWISHGQELGDNNPIQPTHIIESPFQLPELIEALRR